MEISTFEAINVPETHTVDNNTNFLVEGEYVDPSGNTTRVPEKVNLGDLISNIFSNTFSSLLAITIPPPLPVMNIEQLKKNNLKKNKVLNEELKIVKRKLYDIDSQIQQILKEIGQ